VSLVFGRDGRLVGWIRIWFESEFVGEIRK